ncbi:MAG: PAS domain S-box protein, partial [Gammaproteobacteria bacterium]|nr:PAS domain S-box protein [Gammaproteobacteria bacterium]
IEYTSPSVESHLGYGPKEMVGRRLVDFVHPEDRQAVKTMLDSASRGASELVEYRVGHSDGTWHAIESLGSHHPERDGRPRIVINSRDVTQRKLADEALRTSEGRHRTLVDSVPVSIHELDLEGRLLTINQEGLRMLEVSGGEEQVCGLSLVELAAPEDRKTVEACLARAREGQPSEFEYRLEVDGDRKIFASGLVALKDLTGEVTRVIGYSQDVTERRRAERERELLEQQLQQSQKMEALGQLASGVAHDFNNLLTVIAGHTTFLEMISDGAQSGDHIEAIRRALERATSLSRQLLAFGRRQVMRPVVLDLNQVVSNVHGMLRRLIGEHIKLRVETEEEVGRIKADPVQIEQAILNLAVNARDAMPSGGNLTVATWRHMSSEPTVVEGIAIPPGE